MKNSTLHIFIYLFIYFTIPYTMYMDASLIEGRVGMTIIHEDNQI
jgi:hypothetical protein